MQQILVRVRADYPWQIAQVGGRRFHKDVPTQLHPHELTDEIKNSALLEIETLESETVASETPASATVESVEPANAQTVSAEPARKMKNRRGAK